MTKVDHIERARGYIAKGDSYYLKAADEIIAAQKEDPGLSNVEIGRRLGKSDRWVGLLVQARTSAKPDSSELTIDWQRGSHATKAEVEAGARKLIREQAVEVVKEIAAAMEDPEVAQAIAAEATPAALGNVDIAASTESYLRKRAATKPPPADAASRQLGGIGPAAMAEKIHDESMEPAITRIIGAFWSARQRWTQHGFRLALTDPDEFTELDKTVTEIGRLYAEMLDLYDAAKVAKLANEAEGVAS